MEIEAMDDIPLVILFNKTDLKVFDVLRMSPANAPTNDAWCATSRTRSPIAHMLSSPRCPQRRSWTDCSWNQSWQRKKTSGHFGLHDDDYYFCAAITMTMMMIVILVPVLSSMRNARMSLCTCGLI